MSSPWETVPLDAYEAHMASPQVGQLQALGEIMRRQLLRHAQDSVCVLGVAGGNGLEHIDASRIQKVYGIDISADYLDACRHRFSYLGGRLELLRMDLSDAACCLPNTELVIADLVIEYVGAEAFAQLIRASRPAAVCCAVQRSGNAAFVSASPAAESLHCLDAVHRDVEPEALAEALARVGYRQTFCEEYALPNGKQLVCLDFME